MWKLTNGNIHLLTSCHLSYNAKGPLWPILFLLDIMYKCPMSWVLSDSLLVVLLDLLVAENINWLTPIINRVTVIISWSLIHQNGWLCISSQAACSSSVKHCILFSWWFPLSLQDTSVDYVLVNYTSLMRIVLCINLLPTVKRQCINFISLSYQSPPHKIKSKKGAAIINPTL